MKLTRHNGRSGKHGTYNPRHNDRRFDVENSEHIDAERARQNVYWDCYRGFTTHEFRENPERKAPKKEREYAAERLDGVITKIKNAMQHALAKIQRTLMQTEVKQAGKEQIKKKAKESIMDKLAKAKINADRDNRERWEREGRIAPTKKNDMEL